jgi:hypothetical protein
MASIMHDTVTVGDTVLCRGAYATVTHILRYEPGRHPVGIPIKPDYVAYEYVTVRGSRFRGFSVAEDPGIPG